VTGCDNTAPPLICEVFLTFHKKQFSAGKCFRYIIGDLANWIRVKPPFGLHLFWKNMHVFNKCIIHLIQLSAK
jgi:hypothetical protein